VECLWTCSLEGEQQACSHRVLPDNGLDILWQDHRADGFVAGMMSRASTAILPPRVHTVAVRFKPGMAARFFDMPLHELADGHVDLADLWGRAWAARVTDALWEKSLTGPQRLTVLEQHLLDYLCASKAKAAPAYLMHALAAMEASAGALRIEVLADTLGVSRQQLGLQFRERVGLNAKTFARICRFRHAADGIKASRGGAGKLDWAALALEHSYFDQAHMIHEFRDITGSTPESFAAR
jgi:AraC-like DNA-binding protein